MPSDPSKTSPTKLAREKLASSGLDLDNAKKLGVKILSAAKTAKLFPKAPAAPSLQLVYHDVKGAAREGIYRVRLLAPPPPGAFGATNTKLRYLQPKGTPPAAYFPSTLDWADIAKDVGATIIITEGELKAACACKQGFKCVGLGGVSAYRSKKRGWALLPELEAFAWEGRAVVVCFDSDLATNPDVARAAAGIVRELGARGARVAVTFVPDVKGLDKTGLDDFLVCHGRQAMIEVLDAAVDDALTKKLWEFNERFSIVLSPGVIYDEKEDVRYKPRDWRDVIMANVWAESIIGDALKPVRVSKAWIDWPMRRQYSRFVYEPGKRRTVGGALNEWVGWGCTPKRGSIRPWRELLDFLFAGAPRAERDWFECWCYYPLAHPGAKLPTAAALWSVEQGLGKSLVGVALGRIYGKNFSTISQRELDWDFNGWLVAKQFILVDDVSAHDSRAKADILKKMITQETVQVNIKQIPTYELKDRSNLYFTSNQANAFYLEQRDRRFFVHEAAAKKNLGPQFYDEFVAWMNGAGPSALFYHALHYDFKDFHPYAPPPLTASKDEMIAAARSELDAWLAAVRDAPDEKMKLGRVAFDRDLFTPEELLAFFDVERRGRPATLSAMAIRAKEFLGSVFGGRPVAVDGAPERFFAVRNREYWRAAAKKEIVQHVQKCRAQECGSAVEKSKF